MAHVVTASPKPPPSPPATVPKVVNVKAAPVSGTYFPGPVVFYEEWIAGITTTVNDLASEYLSWWFGTAFDESCAAALGPDDQHKCWDFSGLYNHISSPIFIAENRFDQNQINDVLLCPTSRNNSRTNGFVADFGAIMTQGLLDTVRGERGVSKGDGLFSPSCFDRESAARPHPTPPQPTRPDPTRPTG